MNDRRSKHIGPRESLTAVVLAATLVFAAAGSQSSPSAARKDTRLRGVLITPAQATSARLKSWVKENVNAIVLGLSEGEPAGSTKTAAARIRSTGLPLYYWIEIGRNPRFSDSHPEWMASLQGHSEWRRRFPSFPVPAPTEVVKNYPWTPILYREAFEAHIERVALLLENLPDARGIFLNDLQGAPSACGCGNDLCRWTADYGPIRTATPLPPDAASKFVAAVQTLRPRAQIIPVWTTECEEGDKNELCAGVGCFTGACWKEFTSQLMPLMERSEQVAALVPYRAFGRDLERYSSPAGWVKHALAAFNDMPPKRQGRAIPPDRLIAVLQGWETTPAEQKAQIARSEETGAAGYVMALAKIEQSWEPRIIKVP